MVNEIASISDAMAVAAVLFEALHLQLQEALLQSVLHHHTDLFDGQRFFQEVERAQLGGANRGLDLQGGIIVQAAEHDGAHLVVKAGEAAELIEHALAPQEGVGVERQIVAVRAELELLRRAVIVQGRQARSGRARSSARAR